MTIEESYDQAFARLSRENDEYEARQRPIRERLEAFDESTPRVVYREPRYASYRMIRLADVRWVPAHTADVHVLTSRGFKPRKERVADTVRLIDPGHVRHVIPTETSTYVRRPTAKHLARIEAAEAAIAAARAELKAAERAAFTYGKPIPLSTIKRITRERDAIAKDNRTDEAIVRDAD
jgi:hypothetical protein